MEILYILLVLLVVTRLFGELAERVGQPALAGELLSGIALVARYAEAFPVLAGIEDDRVFRTITDLGVFFLMLYGGIEMEPRQLAKASAKAFWVAVLGMVFPLAVGFGVAWYFLPESDYKFAQSLFIGTALAITAVPVAIRVLLDLGKLESEAGRIIVSSALWDDNFSLVLLAVLTSVAQVGKLPSTGGLFLLGGNIAIFFAVTTVVGYFVAPRIMRLLAYFKVSEFDLSVVLIISMGFAWLAETLHLHFIVGAFMAGLFMGRQVIGAEVFHDVKKKVSGITNGFLAPIFFASIGLQLDLSAVTAIPAFLVLLTVIAFATKLVGAGVPAYFVGLSARASLGVGLGMSARGAVELIIADIALRAGLFDHPTPTPPVVAHLFSAVVIVAVLTTIAVPIALRFVFPPPEDNDEDANATDR